MSRRILSVMFVAAMMVLPVLAFGQGGPGGGTPPAGGAGGGVAAPAGGGAPGAGGPAGGRGAVGAAGGAPTDAAAGGAAGATGGARAGRGGAGGGRGGGAAADAGIVLVRPTESPGLGKKLDKLPDPDAEGFISMFNGKDLTGWDALPNFWSVKDGAIDCVETGEQGGNIQSDLSWIDSIDNPTKYANFELRVSFRWMTNTGNSGVQFRGIVDNPTTKHVGGYQPDLDATNAYNGSLYDEQNRNGRHSSGVGGPHMGPRGYKITYPADGGAAKAEPLAENAQTLGALIKPVRGDFNEMVIIADGPKITIKVNGHVFSEVIDEYPTARKDGVIAFQQHAGPQMQIQFKDVKIKFLPATPKP